jgi:hypothetical protein
MEMQQMMKMLLKEIKAGQEQMMTKLDAKGKTEKEEMMAKLDANQEKMETDRKPAIKNCWPKWKPRGRPTRQRQRPTEK